MEFYIIVFAVTYVLLGLGLTSYIFSYLKTHHKSTHIDLGSPSLITNNTASNNWLFLKFIFTNSYKNLGDSKFSRLCVSLKYILVVLVLLMVVIPAHFLNVV
ncbi:MAG: putative membrane protein [Oleispira sp.]|jgi:uncharacterized membrane protein